MTSRLRPQDFLDADFLAAFVQGGQTRDRNRDDLGEVGSRERGPGQGRGRNREEARRNRVLERQMGPVR